MTHEPVDPEVTDALLVQEMNQLSMREREQVFFDVHGVSDVIEESPDFVNPKLSELKTVVLSKMANVKNPFVKMAFREAQTQGLDPLSDSHFLLKFLRADRFQVQQAANRILQFFEEKQKLFPEKNKLTKEITLEDMTTEDIDCLESGICTILPLPDSAGRIVLCWTINLRRLGTSLTSRVGWVCVFFFVLQNF